MVRTAPWLGLLGQLGLVAVLAALIGPSWPGLVIGGGYGLVVAALLHYGLADAIRFGPANTVTLVRAVLVGGVATLTLGVAAWPIVALSSAALMLDNVDGRVARRTSTSSKLGARFDMEIDAFLILLLSVAVAPTVGWWVLLIGTARYLLALGAFLLPWLAEPSPPRYWCKVVATVQGVVLTVAVSGLLPRPVQEAMVAISLLLLVESFGREIGWKWQHRAHKPVVLRPRRSPAFDQHRMPCPNTPGRHLHGRG